MKVIMLAEAIADMEATREFYQEHASTAVAARFLDQVEHASHRLVERPFLGASITPFLRRLLLQQFPYSLIYQADGDVITILAVRCIGGVRVTGPSGDSSTEGIALARPVACKWLENHAKWRSLVKELLQQLLAVNTLRRGDIAQDGGKRANSQRVMQRHRDVMRIRLAAGQADMTARLPRFSIAEFIKPLDQLGPVKSRGSLMRPVFRPERYVGV